LSDASLEVRLSPPKVVRFTLGPWCARDGFGFGVVGVSVSVSVVASASVECVRRIRRVR
jgi:hypothetical protein